MGPYKLLHERVVNDPDDWDTLDGETDRGADHWVPMDLGGQKMSEVRGSELTKLVVPSMGLSVSKEIPLRVRLTRL